MPSAGKSTISEVLQERGFVHIDSDSIRDELFDNPDFLTYRTSPEFKEKEKLVQEQLWNQKYNALSQGKSVYIDSCGGREDWRNGLLNTGDLQAQKYLLELQVDEAILRQRNIDRNRPNDVYKEWSKRWQLPTPKSDVIHIAYQNDTPKDLEFLTEDLRRRF